MGFVAHRGLILKSTLVVLFLCLLAWRIAARQDDLPVSSITIESPGGAHTFVVEVASTPSQRERGLMNRYQMAQDHGMLFVFPAPRDVVMWMKNTKLPLDMVFIRSDRTILHVHENAEPEDLTLISSHGEVLYVLELNAGISRRLGIGVDEAVSGPALNFDAQQ